MQIPLLGPTNVSRIYTSDPEETINLFSELPQAGRPLATNGLIKRPALRPWARCSGGPIRGLYEINGRAFAVAGTMFGELAPNRVFVPRGPVAVNTDPVTWASNGDQGEQIMFTSGGFGYYFSLAFNDLHQITDDGFPANVLMCDYLASKGIVQVKDTNTFFYSAENDFSSWNSLDTFSTSLTADRKLGMKAIHGELWLLGTQRSEVWQATGEQNTAFAPVAATVVEQGTSAGFSPQIADNALFLLQGDARGNCMVVRTNGYGFTVVSTNAISFYLHTLARQSAETITNAIGWTFQLEGHACYALYLPGAPYSLVYDISTDQWFYWAHWDSRDLVWRQLRARNHIFFRGHHLVGSPNSPVIYELALPTPGDSTFEADGVVV